MKLVEIIPWGLIYSLYFGNWFSSVSITFAFSYKTSLSDRCYRYVAFQKIINKQKKSMTSDNIKISFRKKHKTTWKKF